MTTVYFVRHAEPNYGNHNDRLRELCAWQKIKADRFLPLWNHHRPLCVPHRGRWCSVGNLRRFTGLRSWGRVLTRPDQ